MGLNKLFLIIIFLLVSLNAYSTDEEFVQEYSKIIDIDSNAGLTTFPLLEIPTFSKYTGMGSAYIAMSGDAGFFESNPASSSRLSNTSVSAIHREWIADSSIESLTFGDRKNNIGYGSEIKLLYLPFTSYNSWGERRARAYYSESLISGNISHNFFRNYYFSGLSIGTNLKLLHRSTPEVLYSDKNVGEQSNTVLASDLGLLTKFNFLKPYPSTDNNFGIGISIKNLKLLGVKDEDLPTELITGISYSPIRAWTIDFDYRIPFKYKSPTMAVGQNLNITDFFSIQSGFEILSGNLRLTTGAKLDLKNGASVSINYMMDATGYSLLDKFTAQVSLNLGDNGREKRRIKRNKYYTEGLNLYAAGKLKRALEYFRASYKIDPNFTPAYENILTLERKLNLIDRMERVQKVK